MLTAVTLCLFILTLALVILERLYARRRASLLARSLEELTARIKDKTEAEARAEELLYSHLTTEQVEFYRKRGYVVVTTPKYDYHVGSAGIQVYWNGKYKGFYCAIPARESLPHADLVLARILHLRFNEEEFTTRIANWVRNRR